MDGSGNVYVADEGNNRIQKFAPAGGSVAFSLDDEPGQPNDSVEQSITFADLLPGDYTIAEIVPNPWALLSINCGEAGSATSPETQITVTLQPGQSAICTFTNEKPNLETDGTERIYLPLISK